MKNEAGKAELIPEGYKFRWRATIKKAPESLAASGAQDGDYLLSHLRSTIGVTKLNFSVRNGKRWNLRAIVT